jgi:hypothetical protein
MVVPVGTMGLKGTIVPKIGYYRVLQAYAAEGMSRLGLGLSSGFAHTPHGI